MGSYRSIPNLRFTRVSSFIPTGILGNRNWGFSASTRLFGPAVSFGTRGRGPFAFTRSFEPVVIFTTRNRSHYTFFECLPYRARKSLVLTHLIQREPLILRRFSSSLDPPIPEPIPEESGNQGEGRDGFGDGGGKGKGKPNPLKMGIGSVLVAGAVIYFWWLRRPIPIISDKTMEEAGYSRENKEERPNLEVSIETIQANVKTLEERGLIEYGGCAAPGPFRDLWHFYTYRGLCGSVDYLRLPAEKIAKRFGIQGTLALWARSVYAGGATIEFTEDGERIMKGGQKPGEDISRLVIARAHITSAKDTVLITGLKTQENSEGICWSFLAKTDGYAPLWGHALVGTVSHNLYFGYKTKEFSWHWYGAGRGSIISRIVNNSVAIGYYLGMWPSLLSTSRVILQDEGAVRKALSSGLDFEGMAAAFQGPAYASTTYAGLLFRHSQVWAGAPARIINGIWSSSLK